MAPSVNAISENSLKANESLFLLCDQCLWTVTCLNKKYLEDLAEISESELSCPLCKQDPLSSFPVTHNDSFRYSYSKKRGLELTFGIKNK
jgi:hypothetical protein